MRVNESEFCRRILVANPFTRRELYIKCTESLTELGPPFTKVKSGGQSKKVNNKQERRNRTKREEQKRGKREK